ncbi:hypothetical protein EBT25_12410 [bacterium]|jgi:hypothetical protein|nr:hypothetical protein [bacterium]
MKKNQVKKSANEYWARRRGKPTINETMRSKKKPANHREKVTAWYRTLSTPRLVNILHSRNSTTLEKNIALTLLHRRMYMY